MRPYPARHQELPRDTSTPTNTPPATNSRHNTSGRVPHLDYVSNQPELFPSPAQLHRITAANHAAAAFYRHHLATTPTARTYLRQRLGDSRHFPPTVVIGYAPPTWTALLDHLRHHGHRDADLVEAGLVQYTRRNTLIDQFRDRILIGLHTDQGHLAGFIGRAPHHHINPRHTRKYLNTPTTALFDKSQILFGLHEFHHRLTHGATPVIVEGPFDALATATIPNTDRTVAPLAPSGTAVTPHHLAAILHTASADTIVLAMDSDPSGRRAALRIAEMALTTGKNIQAASLPDGHDPASWARSHPHDTLDLLLNPARTRPAVHLLIDAHIEQHAHHLHFPEGKIAAIRDIAATLHHLPPETVAAEALRIATHLDIDPLQIADAIGALNGTATQDTP